MVGLLGDFSMALGVNPECLGPAPPASRSARFSLSLSNRPFQEQEAVSRNEDRSASTSILYPPLNQNAFLAVDVAILYQPGDAPSSRCS